MTTIRAITLPNDMEPERTLAFLKDRYPGVAKGARVVTLTQERAASLDRHFPDSQRWVSEWEGVEE